MNKKNIAKSFGKASETYEMQAPVQKWTAQLVSDQVTILDLKSYPDCLEIGCGTGFLTTEMMELYPHGKWTISDLSQEMLDLCYQKVERSAEFMVMDGEYPRLEKSYDLIVSSLAFQWFNDLEGALKRLSLILKPGGHLVFSTLGGRSFEQWSENLKAMGEINGMHAYPCVNDFEQMQIEDCSLQVSNFQRLQPYDNALSFLRALKMIGAQEPRKGYTPLTVGRMRKIMKNLENSGACDMTYDIMVVHMTKEGGK